MNTRIVLLLILGISFLFFGCAKPAEEEVAPTVETGEVKEEMEVTEEEEVPVEEELEEVPPAEEPEEEIPEGVSEEDQALADLFQIDTDEPLGDQGLGTETPSAQEENTS